MPTLFCLTACWRPLRGVLLGVLLAGAAAVAAAQEVPSIDCLVESGPRLSLDEVEALPDSAWRSCGTSANMGFTTQPVWFRARTVQHDTAEPTRLLEVAQPLLDRIELHLHIRAESGAERREEWMLGDQLPFDERPVRNPGFVVPVQLPYGATLDILARVHSASSVQFPLTVWHPQAFGQHLQSLMLLEGAYAGLLAGLLVYNLIIWLATRERSYLLYVGWVATLGPFLCSTTGLTFQYLWPEQPWLNDTAPLVLLALAAAAGAGFAGEFLRIAGGPAWRRHMVRALVTLGLTQALLSLVLPYGPMIQANILLAVLSILLITLLAALRAREGYRPAGTYIVAFAAVLGGGLVLALNKAGFIDRNLLTDSAPMIGSALEVMLISLGLAARLNEERQARLEAQADALTAQQEARELLEARVAERTQALELANSRLSRLSLTDGLTGIPNRRFLDEVLSREVSHAAAAHRPLSVALIDVDHFKRLNDQHGHQAGDRCLQAVARALQLQVHRSEDLVARYGGEEFCVVMPQAGPEGALIVAERMRLAVAGLAVEAEAGCEALQLTVSIGVCSLVPVENDGGTALLRAADEALYQAKHGGRDRVVVHGGGLPPGSLQVTPPTWIDGPVDTLQ